MLYICTFWLLMAGLAYGLPERVPTLMKTKAEEPRDALVPLGGSSEVFSEGVNAGSLWVRCDASNVCRDRRTCCHHPGGGWTCCPYYPAQCCLDGYHCCPHGYHCNWNYTRCLKRGVPYPFLVPMPAAMMQAVKTDGNPSSDQE